MINPITFALEGTDNPNDPHGVARFGCDGIEVSFVLNDFATASKLSHLLKSAYQRGRSDTALARPEPEGPTDEELDIVVIAIQRLAPDQPDGPTQPTHDLHAVDRGREILKQHLARFGRPAVEPLERWFPSFADWLEREMPEGTVIGDPLWWASKIATYLQRYGRPAIKPVPVAERLPGPEDCNADDECWWFDPAGTDGAWYVDTYQGNYTHWLPHWALPVPTSQENP